MGKASVGRAERKAAERERAAAKKAARKAEKAARFQARLAERKESRGQLPTENHDQFAARMLAERNHQKAEERRADRAAIQEAFSPRWYQHGID